MQSGHGKKGILLRLVEFKGKPSPPPKKKGRHWATWVNPIPCRKWCAPRSKMAPPPPPPSIRLVPVVAQEAQPSGLLVEAQGVCQGAGLLMVQPPRVTRGGGGKGENGRGCFVSFFFIGEGGQGGH